MLKDRVVIRSDKDDHVLFRVFKAYYPFVLSEEQPYYEHKHSELEISVIMSGSGRYNCSGEEYEFRRGDVFWHCGEDSHCFQRIDKDEKLSLLVIQFEPRLIWSSSGEWFDSKYLQIFMGNNRRITRHISSDFPVSQEIFRLLNECFEEGQMRLPAYNMFIKANLLRIISNLVRYYYNSLDLEMDLGKKEKIECLGTSIDYILEHLEEEITLDKLAKEAGMSRSYYSTMFKKLNGISVWSFITNQRVDRAQQMLKKTSNSILEISQYCGFGNISNFNRVFKRITGKTPKEYRNDASV